MTKKPNFDRPHYVDEDTETVYVAAGSWGGAVSAPFWVEEFFPGYKTVLLSSANLKKKIKGDTQEDA